jgi:hypothetical protein
MASTRPPLSSCLDAALLEDLVKHWARAVQEGKAKCCASPICTRSGNHTGLTSSLTQRRAGAPRSTRKRCNSTV